MQTIPDDCFVSILSFLDPILDLFRLLRVSKVFLHSATIAIRDVHKLSLSVEGIPTLDKKELWWRHAGIDATRRVLDNFPNVKYLQVSTRGMHFWPQMVNLMTEVIGKTPLRKSVQSVIIFIDQKWDMIERQIIHLEQIFDNLKEYTLMQVDYRYSYVVFHRSEKKIILQKDHSIRELNEFLIDHPELNTHEFYKLDQVDSILDKAILTKILTIRGAMCSVEPSFTKEVLPLWKKVGFDPNAYIREKLVIQLFLEAFLDALRTFKPTDSEEVINMHTYKYLRDVVTQLVQAGLDEQDAKEAASSLDKRNKKYQDCFSFSSFIQEFYPNKKIKLS
jgi:hypothetical protein